MLLEVLSPSSRFNRAFFPGLCYSRNLRSLRHHYNLQIARIYQAKISSYHAWKLAEFQIISRRSETVNLKHLYPETWAFVRRAISPLSFLSTKHRCFRPERTPSEKSEWRRVFFSFFSNCSSNGLVLLLPPRWIQFTPFCHSNCQPALPTVTSPTSSGCVLILSHLAPYRPHSEPPASRLSPSWRSDQVYPTTAATHTNTGAIKLHLSHDWCLSYIELPTTAIISQSKSVSAYWSSNRPVNTTNSQICRHF